MILRVQKCGPILLDVAFLTSPCISQSTNLGLCEITIKKENKIAFYKYLCTKQENNHKNKNRKREHRWA